jgi:hypothetical protein
LACPSAALCASVFIRAHPSNPWFSKYVPAWQAKRKLVFFPRDFWTKQGHLRSRMSDGVSQSRASLLVKGFETAAPAWLVQAQPCASLPIRVNPAYPWLKNDFTVNDFAKEESREARVQRR